MGIDPISLGVMAVGTIVSGVGAIKNANAQQAQLKAQGRMADVEAQQARLEQVRQSRIARAKIEQAGADQGVGESSSVTTGASGVVGQAESNINYINNQQDIDQAIFKAKSAQVSASGIESLGEGLQKLGGSVFANSDKIKDIFSGG